MVKILVAEDDAALNSLVCTYLKASGYDVVSCKDGREAWDKLQDDRFDMLITDIMMPQMDGFALAKLVREYDRHIPIIFMTAKDDKQSKQQGYGAGIDEYITKPFDLDELIMRVGAILRRTRADSVKQLTVGNFTMDREEHTAFLNGEELPLTVREFDLLFKLLSFPRRTFTRSQLMEEFWDYDSSATSRTIDVFMVKLRDKTSECTGFEIVTVRGLGYKAVLR